jgi:hypothetical protein
LLRQSDRAAEADALVAEAKAIRDLLPANAKESAAL